jgi:excinuclease ABC subunit C
VDEILKKLALVPPVAGVYLMKDGAGAVIYIGKAKNLVNRLSSYFKSGSHDAKTTAMLEKVRDFEYFICGTENDALCVEANFIRRHSPHYNILLKDNKSFPYILVGDGKIEITRKLNRRGKYFGPYFNGIWASGLVDTIYDIFGVRDGVIDAGTIANIKSFLRGENNFNAYEILTKKMETAAQMQQFELAIRYRNGISFLDKLKERSVGTTSRNINADVFAGVASADFFVVSVVTVRAGSIIGINNFSAKDNSPLENDEKLQEFIAQYYLENIRPDEVLTVAQRGYKKRLVDIAQSNAEEYLKTSIEKIEYKSDFTLGACAELGKFLGLARTPRKIECYDNSHMGGENATGGMVVFIDGAPNKKLYRKFRIRQTNGCDDYESMREVLARRFRRLGRSDGDDNGLSGGGGDGNGLSVGDGDNYGERFPAAPDTDVRARQNFDNYDESFSVAPDLIVLDGGKGQLSVVCEIMKEAGVDIPIIAFADFDQIFLPREGLPRFLERRSYALRLLQRLRDESHRYANEYRKNLAKKRMEK